MHPKLVALLEQFSETEGRFLKWAAWAILNWKPSFEEPPVPVVQIHGDRDFILPHTCTRPDILVHGAGHLLPVTHPEVVNRFLVEQIARFSAP